MERGRTFAACIFIATSLSFFGSYLISNHSRGTADVIHRYLDYAVSQWNCAGTYKASRFARRIVVTVGRTTSNQLNVGLSSVDRALPWRRRSSGRSFVPYGLFSIWGLKWYFEDYSICIGPLAPCLCSQMNLKNWWLPPSKFWSNFEPVSTQTLSFLAISLIDVNPRMHAELD